MTDCDEEYINVGEEAFADGQYVTTDLLRKFCRAIAYLKGREEALTDSTDPERRKRFTPIVLEEYLSYGVIQDGNNFKFDSTLSKAYSESFTSDDNIDIVNTTAFVDLSAAAQQVQLTPTIGSETENAKCAGPWLNYGLNAAWSVGWDNTKPYWVNATAYKTPFSATIPSIARCETFSATATEAITTVTMVVQGNPNAEDDIYLEIRPVDGDLKPTSTVLARVKGNARKFTATNLLAFKFPKPLKITSGTRYAIVVRSPFTTYLNHYGLGGWGINCGSVCPTGEAWTSYDNCATWVRHGRTEAALPYREGAVAPLDFAFNVKTVPLTATYTTNANGEYVYLEPVRTNPITSVTLTPTESKPANTNIIYEVSPDGVTWYAVNAGNSWTKTYSAPKPIKQFVRAKLTTTVAGSTPLLQQIDLNFVTEAATTGYLRSKTYYPPTTMPLGMSIWSELNAPYTAEPNTTVAIEIMKATQKTDRFTTNGVLTTFTLSELPAEPMVAMLFTTTAGVGTALKELVHYTVNYDTGVVTVLGSALAAGELKAEYYPLFLKGLTSADFPLKVDFFSESFTATAGQTVFQLKTHPCDPIRTVTVNGVEKVEDVDFTVDYQLNRVTFGVGRTLNDAVVVEYTPELPDNGLAINYRITRTTTTPQVSLQPAYYQYRV